MVREGWLVRKDQDMRQNATYDAFGCNSVEPYLNRDDSAHRR
jgi:hypothetical protein